MMIVTPFLGLHDLGRRTRLLPSPKRTIVLAEASCPTRRITMPRSQKQATRRPATKFPHLQKKIMKAKAQLPGGKKPPGKKK
jgi:hypothetical protein